MSRIFKWETRGRIRLLQRLSAYELGLVGHSHIDTVWLWHFDETKRKLARTFSNALRMMEQYPEYIFMASSAYHYKIILDYYPAIFEEIKTRVKEGRWEINGGSWIEMDCNIIGGETMIRQFLAGQYFFLQHFGKIADVFWLPDTFGYSAAIPQILKSFGIQCFCSTKLSWNDTNPFPYDTFVWEGIDGTRVNAHFHLIHFWPDVKEALTQSCNGITHKHISTFKLMPYGFGDGGGGPSPDMIEMARRIKNLDSVPQSSHTTVSSFTTRIFKEAKNIPCYSGELYVEGHRGTLTSIHDIKWYTRKIEFLLRDVEIIGLFAGYSPEDEYFSKLNRLYMDFLPQQFHDILPGTCIARAHDEALSELRRIWEQGNELRYNAAGGDATDNPNSNAYTVYNTLNWPRSNCYADGKIKFKGVNSQHYKDITNTDRTYFSGIDLRPLSASVFEVVFHLKMYMNAICLKQNLLR